MTSDTRPHRGKPIGLHIVFLLITPLAVAILVPWWAMVHGITWTEISAMMALWIVTGMGITVGYHRMFAHCSFRGTFSNSSPGRRPVRLF